MRRCTACFRFQTGRPTYCSYCGRSFDVRICSRGHRNPRGAQFCAECGSADLSTPTPRASFLHRLSGAVLYLFSGFLAVIVVLTLVLSIASTIDWDALSGPLVSLALMMGALYWTTTLLPGPIKKVGHAAGKRLVSSLKRKERK